MLKGKGNNIVAHVLARHAQHLDKVHGLTRSQSALRQMQNTIHLMERNSTFILNIK